MVFFCDSFHPRRSNQFRIHFRIDVHDAKYSRKESLIYFFDKYLFYIEVNELHLKCQVDRYAGYSFLFVL